MRDCSIRRVSLSPTRARPSTQSSPRRPTGTTTAVTTSAVSAGDKKPTRPIQTTHHQQQQQQQPTDNPYAVKLQRETEAMLRQTKPSQTSAAPTTTQLRTFSCGSVPLSVCLSASYVSALHSVRPAVLIRPVTGCPALHNVQEKNDEEPEALRQFKPLPSIFVLYS